MEGGFDMKKRLLQTLRKRDDFLCALATVGTDGRPHVRYVRATIRDDLIILCPTFASTQKVRDVEAYAHVSVTCGDTDSGVPGSYFQIAGRAVVSQCATNRAAAWTPRIERWFSGPDDAAYAVVVVIPERILALPIGGGPAAQTWERTETSPINTSSAA